MGENRIQASQDEGVSNEVVVNRLAPPTLIRITSPRNGQTRRSSVRVMGTAANPTGNTVTLTVNSSPRLVPITNGVFASDVELAFGETRIQASQGNAVSNEVVVTRPEPPRTLIQITSPASGLTRRSSVKVTGAITNPRGDALTLTVNGTAINVQITNGAFAYDVKLGSGDTHIQASQGSAVSNEVVVTRRAEPPRTLIQITSPASGPTRQSSVRVTGTIINPRGDTLTLTVNGEPIKVQITDGGFSYSVKVGSGVTHIQASQGNAASNEVVVTRRAEPPRTLVQITSPASGPTTESSVRVTGTIINPRGDALTLTVNRYASNVQITNGAFAYSVKLSLGRNLIQASQGGVVSNQVVVSRVEKRVVERPPAPAECSKINCDCKNLRASRSATDAWRSVFLGARVTGGSPSFPTSANSAPQDRQARCRAEEDNLRRRCKETGKVTGVCPPDASGPAAWPSRKPRPFILKKPGGNKQ